MDIDISIIIPMYNTAKFINECINSITSRFLNIEIIIIDDGSKDNSYQIANEIALKDKRIKLLKTENNGPGNARNTGLSIAKGKCIAFIDSDDWITENSLDIMFQEMTSHNLDIVMGNALFYYHSEDVRKRYKIPTALFEKIQEGKKCYIELSNANSFIPMVYCYMYRHDFLKKNHICFQNEMYEDELWTLQTVCLANRIKIINHTFYFYRQRSGSIMHSETTSSKMSDSLIALSKNILSFSQNTFFTKDSILKSWLYAKAIQMFYYALIKFNKKETLMAFYKNNEEFLSVLIKNRNEISSDTANYFFKYYLYHISKLKENMFECY